MITVTLKEILEFALPFLPLRLTACANPLPDGSKVSAGGRPAAEQAL